MSYWDLVRSVSSPHFPWVIAGFFAIVLCLWALAPLERRRLRAAINLFFLSAICFGGAAALLRSGADPKTSVPFLVIHWIALFTLSIALIAITSVLLFDVLLGHIHLRPPQILRDILIGLCYCAIAILLLSMKGVNLSGIIATSAVITAVVGFSLQDTLGNIMGGMALQMDHTIQLGDWLRLPDLQEGQVVELRWRQTSIQTRNWDTIVIPNSVLMKAQVTVMGRRVGQPRQQRRWVYFNVDFRHSPADVIRIIDRALKHHQIPNMADEPPPHCIATEFKESYVTYAARYWLTDLALTDPTDSLVRSLVFAALARESIVPSIPAQAVFLESDTERRRQRKRDRELERRLAAISGVEVFQSLNAEERRDLAGCLLVAPFVRGEMILHQESEAHRLYIITKGKAEVRAAVDGTEQKVADLGVNDYFGEIGLMTGEPRTASVYAASDMECYRVDKDSFQEILRGRPEIAHDISHILARRQVELDHVYEHLTEEARRHHMNNAQRAILDRIVGFFRLQPGE